jgi:hypothetical protein
MGNITAIAPEVPTIRAHVLPILLEPHSTGPRALILPKITPVLSDLPPILAILRNLATWRTALREREATAERDRQGNQSSKRSSLYDHLSSLWSEQPALVMASRGYSVDRS